MSWRIVVIENQAKLDYKMGYMVVRGLETKRVLLDEIGILSQGFDQKWCYYAAGNCKMMTSPSMEKSMKNMVHNNKPPKGLIQTITITEKQFVKMDYIVGEYTSDIIDSEERLIIL